MSQERTFSRRTLLAAAALTATGTSGEAQEPRPAEEPIPEAKPEDVGAIDAILKALYDVISGPQGQARDWDRFRSLFAPGARLIPAVPRRGAEWVNARVLTVAEFVEASRAATERSGFFETEIARTTEQFGPIAHAFSTYESRREKDAEPFTRGINSFQLVNDGGRWRVVTIFWAAERDDTPIPDKYLPRPK